MSEDATFSRDARTRGFSVNVPRLYCETIGAPVTEEVMQYCLRRDGWRREQLMHLARRLEDVVNGDVRGQSQAGLEAACRAEARRMLDDDDVTAWTPMDAERVTPGTS